MRIAVASGKGGTGKTTVAVNLALSLSNVQLVDADVEEPNAHVFFELTDKKEEEITVEVPRIDHKTCTFCGKCSSFCAYNALAVVKRQVLVFPELCHACTGCALICPVDAIDWDHRSVGVLRMGLTMEKIAFLEGELNTGEAMAIPVIKALKKRIDQEKTVILDAPPGTSCPVIETIQDADVVLLVTEPTPFGLHDLKLAVEVVRMMNVPFGVIINRDGIGDDRVDIYCKEENIPILLRIPHDRQIAVWYSEGIAFVTEMPEMKQAFQRLYQMITRMVKK
jgi:MinD superfamily P-loop ATPase